MKMIISILVISVMFMGCDETKKVIDAAGQVQLSGTYSITAISGNNIAENAPNITFATLEKKVNGSTGCNRFFGTYVLDLYALSFSGIASTEMACPEPIMSNEYAFLSALDQCGSYALENGILTLYSKTDRSVLLTAIKQNIKEN
jgi:heat shock protein HslJ